MTAYTQQLDQKIQYLQQLFQGLDFPEIQVFESPEQHYRMRAEFRIWHEGGEMFYAMFERGQKASGASLIRCDQFPAAPESINASVPPKPWRVNWAFMSSVGVGGRKLF